MFRFSVPGAMALVWALAMLPLAGVAAQYPDRPVRLVVPYAAGGGTDIVARLLADRMRVALGQPVVVENKPGANGTIGADMVARAPADGYTLLLGGMGPLAINPSLVAQMPYEPTKAFAPVVQVSSMPFVLVAGPSASATDFPSLMAQARAKDAKVTGGLLVFSAISDGTQS